MITMALYKAINSLHVLNTSTNKEKTMTQTLITIHETVAPFANVFYACTLFAAALLILTTIKINLEAK